MKRNKIDQKLREDRKKRKELAIDKITNDIQTELGIVVDEISSINNTLSYNDIAFAFLINKIAELQYKINTSNSGAKIKG